MSMGAATVRAIPWGLGDVVAAVLTVLVGSVLFAVVLGGAAALLARGEDLAHDPLALGLLLAGVAATELLMLGAAAWWSLGKYRVQASALGWRRSWRGGPWAVAATLLGVYVVLGAYVGLASLLGLRWALPQQQQLPEGIFHHPALAAAAGIAALVLAPVAEETFFRGFLFGCLRERWGLAAAAVVSGLAFGIAHLQLPLLVPITGIGIVLAMAYAYSGSILPAVLAHFAVNAIAFGAALAGVG